MIDLKALVLFMTLMDYQELSLYELSVKVGFSIKEVKEAIDTVCRGQDIGGTVGAGVIDEHPRTDKSSTYHELYDTAALSPLVGVS